ncbi:MAG: hypothetical protein AAB932_02035 [Patescibacteria group bacterium]
MITIPLYVILFAYLAYLCVFFIFVLFNVYHIVMSASFTLPSFFVTFFVSSLAIFTLYFTWQLSIGVDWQMPIIDMNAPTQETFFEL